MTALKQSSGGKHREGIGVLASRTYMGKEERRPRGYPTARQGIPPDTTRWRPTDDGEGSEEGDWARSSQHDAQGARHREVGDLTEEGAWTVPISYDYPATLERDEDARFVVTFPDFGWGATDGESLEEALDEAEDLLRELIATTMREGVALPKPSPPTSEQVLVHPPVQIALKAALYEAVRDCGAPTGRLADALQVAESDILHMLDPFRATRTALLDAALRQLGRQPGLTFHQARAI